MLIEFPLLFVNVVVCVSSYVETSLYPFIVPGGDVPLLLIGWSDNHFNNLHFIILLEMKKNNRKGNGTIIDV